MYREEQRDLAVGERILFTESHWDAYMRSGDFATVEKIGEDGMLAVRLDNGKSVELTSDQAQQFEYGYAVDTAHRAAVDRILVTGDAASLQSSRKHSRVFLSTSATSRYTHRTAASLDWRRRVPARRLR